MLAQVVQTCYGMRGAALIGNGTLNLSVLVPDPSLQPNAAKFNANGRSVDNLRFRKR